MTLFLRIKDLLLAICPVLCIVLGIVQVGMAQCGATATPAMKVFAIQASCTNGSPNSDAYLQISEISNGDKYGYSSGTSYTGDAYVSASPTTGLTYPVVIASTIPNPLSDSTFTIRVFNGSNTCFTDSTIVLKVQDCTVTCDCVQHLYLNDTGPDDVHKYAINPSSGDITEIGNPWFDGDDITLDGPHGIAADFNGYLYIGSDPDSFIKKFTCDGVPVDADPATPAFDNFADINPGRNMFSIGNYLYVNPLGDSKVHLFDLCTGDDIGCMGNIWSWGFVNGEDGYWYGSNGLRIMRGSTDPAAYVDNCDNSGVEILCELPSHFTGGTDNLANTGLALDGNGGYFIVISGSNGFQPPSTIYHIDENCTPIDSSFTDYSTDTDDTDNRNWAGARGLVVENGFLYVATADDCVAVFDTDLNYISNFSDHTKGVYPKAIGKINECCPTNNNITVDTTFCASSVNDILYLQDLVNCTGTICEGIWAEGTSNTGLTYNSCNNSITINSTAACGSFTLESDGTGNNPQCGAFKITVNITVASLNLTLTPTTCTDNLDGTFTAAYEAVVDWTSVPCTLGELIQLTHNGAIVRTIDPSTESSPTTVNIAIAATGTGTQSFKAAFSTDICSTDSIAFKTPLPCTNDVNSCTNTTGCLGGNAFDDLNCNGTEDTNEVGVQAVQVVIYDCQNEVVDTVWTDSDGDWQLCGLTDGAQFRIEFSLPECLATWLRPTHSGGDNGTDVQFVTTPACANFSLSDPSAYCQSTPYITTNCYVFGDQATGQFKELETLVTKRKDWGVDETETSTDWLDWQGGNTPNYVAYAKEIGATWGIAYSKQRQIIYTAAFLKQYVGFGPDGPGAIYQVPMDVSNGEVNGTPSLYVDIVNDLSQPMCADPHGTDTISTTPVNVDNVLNLVGECGLGDLEISDDENYLYTVNLSNRTVLKIDIDNQTIVNQWAVPINNLPTVYGVADPDDIRPFALGYHKGELYVGAINSGESSTQDGSNGNRSLLHVYVWKVEETTGTFTRILDYQLRTQRLQWAAWKSTLDGLITHGSYDDYGANGYLKHGQPLLTDIEFYKEDLILGIRDISGDQLGSNIIVNTSINSDMNGDFVSGTTVGDVTTACWNGVEYIMEANGACGDRLGTPGLGNGDFNDEFYNGDGGNSVNGNGHKEGSLGGLAQCGMNDLHLYMTQVNPAEALGTAIYSSAGISSLDNETGQIDSTYIFYRTVGTGTSSFGKANGLGDIEFLCEPAPLEIGNYVWCDSIRNGIQDACEKGVDSMLVQLFDATGLLVGQDTTLNGGHYYFNQYNVDTIGITVDGDGAASPSATGWTGMNYETKYYLVFANNSQYDPTIDKFTIGAAMYDGITTVDVNSNGNDNIDSDVDGTTLSTALGSMPANLPTICMTTAAIGCGNHQYDMGVLCMQVDSSDYADACLIDPCHFINEAIYLGDTITPDATVIANAMATGDTDEGVHIPTSLDVIPGGTINLPVTMYNVTGVTAYLHVWVDWNGDGDFEDTDEFISTTSYATSTYSGSFIDAVTINVPDNALEEAIGMRWRFSTDNSANAITPCGTGICAINGEVEDYLIEVKCKSNICLPTTFTIRRGRRN